MAQAVLAELSMLVALLGAQGTGDSTDPALPPTRPVAPAQPPAPGYPPPGYPPPGYAPPGYPPPGYPPPGYPPPGYPPPGYPPPGYAPYAAPPAAPAEPREPKPEPPPEPRSWLLRIDLGLGWMASSEHEDLLSEDGYGLGPLFGFGLTGDFVVADPLALGAWFLFQTGSDEPDRGGPELDYSAYFVGAELPVIFGNDVAGFIAPRFGVGWGTLKLGSSGGNTQRALAYGLSGGVLWTKAHIGISLGILRAPTDPPSGVGRDFDLGSTLISVTGVFDG